MSQSTRQRIDNPESALRAKLADRAWIEGGWRTDPLKREFDDFLLGTSSSEWAHLFVELAVDIARRFLKGDVDFDFADVVMNQAYDVALQLNADEYTYPGLFDEIYQAFDDGEWDHFGKTEDPVAEFTIPKLKQLISKVEEK